ncbi:hypothetical protein L21SP2_2539 [Salinispira pacifica]|uniref:J domain-containing protein n=1 Tax=Salinispira pacifica TaxID=1307761 RepID=V5WL20_9SPIO|nr:hypothetical protein L21SP2_2539 [Salinispira pacifica]
MDSSFLTTLNSSRLKAAYRRRVKDRHPDSSVGSSESFIILRNSYERLLDYLDNGTDTRLEEAGSPPAPPPGDIPGVHLPLGQFLLYSGRIQWKQLVEALCWRRTSKGPIGRYFLKEGLMTPRELNDLLLRQYRHNRKYSKGGGRI